MKYTKRLRTALENETSEASSQVINQMLFDLREIDEIIEITLSFDSTPNSEEFKRLQLIAKGSDHPDSEPNSKARDAQYELYLRSLLTKAGIVTQQQRPDLFIQSGQYSYPVEAKRPKSEKAVDGLLREAVRQLSRYKHPGIVALSLDQIARPKGQYVRVISLDELNSVTQDCLDLFKFEQSSKIATRLRGRNVAGVFYTMKIPGFVTSLHAACLTVHAHFDCFLTENDPHFEIVSTFEGVLNSMNSP